MGERVRVVRHGERLLAAKEAGPAGAEALRAEAAVLDRLRVPGVVELVGVRAGEPPALLTVWVGTRSLGDLPRPVGPEHAAALCLAVAATLQRLHRAGIVHGAVDPTHVLLDTHGRPVLCGFGSAGPIGAPVRRRATDRPAPPPASGRTATPAGTLGTADDVAGLGRLLGELLGPTVPGGLGLTARRRAARWRALHAVVELATDPVPSSRPSLGAVVRSIRRAAPDAHLPGTDPDEGSRLRTATPSPALPPRPRTAPARHSTGRRLAGRSLVPAVAVAAVGATAYLGLSAWWSTDTVTAGAATSPAPPASPAPSTTGSRPTPTTSTTSTTSATTTAAVPTPTPTDTDRTATGGPTVVVHGGRRYAVGAAGDVVAVGPWRCDGVELAAVLRPSDGTVSLFDAWATDSATAAARTVATVPGAIDLVRVDDGPGCAALVVSGPGGVMATLDAEALR